MSESSQKEISLWRARYLNKKFKSPIYKNLPKKLLDLCEATFKYIPCDCFSDPDICFEESLVYSFISFIEEKKK